MKVGWKAIVLIGILLAAGVGLILAGHPDEGKILTGIVAVAALAIFGVNKARGRQA